jgi:hypothetical protein
MKMMSAKRLVPVKRQEGVSIFGVLVILALLSFFLTVAIRLLPPWMEGRSVKQAVESVVEASNSTMSVNEVVKRLDSTFNTNRIEAISSREVKVYRDKGKIIIDANYEKRTPLFNNVDAVLMFNDHTFVIE